MTSGYANPRKRQNIFEDGDADTLSPAYSKAPWTASRCYRLLQPIESRMATLRKAKTQTQNTAGELASKSGKSDIFLNGNTAEEDHARLEQQRKNSSSDSEEKSNGPRRAGRDLKEEEEEEWVTYPSKSRAGVKHSCKYGRLNRNRKAVDGDFKQKCKKTTPPGELTLSTPFISRHFGPERLHEPGEHLADGTVVYTPGVLCEQPGNAFKARKRQRLHQLSQYLSNDKFGNPFRLSKDSQTAGHTNLAKDFSQLLFATDSSAQSKGGSRSLLAMCLRKIPFVIR